MKKYYPKGDGMDNANVDTIIGLNVTLKGNIKNQGSIQVNGYIEGEVRSDENVDIGETAKVKGPVVARTIVVSGEVNGLIEATERLEIKPTGKVTGDINAKNLIIQSGATFVGKSIMPSAEAAKAKEEAPTAKVIEETPTIKDESKSEPAAIATEASQEDKKEKDPLGFFRK